MSMDTTESMLFEVQFTQPSLGLDLFPHKITINSRTFACCQVLNSKNVTEIQPLDLLISVNGVSLLGSKEMGDFESSQDHFEVAVDRIVASTLPRTIRVFRLQRYTTQADGITAVTLNPDEQFILERGSLVSSTLPAPIPTASPVAAPPSVQLVHTQPVAPPPTPQPPAAMAALSPRGIPPPPPLPPSSNPILSPSSQVRRDSASSTSSSSKLSYNERERIRQAEEEEKRLYTESFNRMVKENRAKREQDRLEEDRMAEEAKKKKEELLRLLGAKPRTPVKPATGAGAEAAGAGTGATGDLSPKDETAATNAEEARRHKKEYLKMLGAYVKEDDQT